MFNHRQRIELVVRRRPNLILILFLIYVIVLTIGVTIPDLIARRQQPVVSPPAHPAAITR